jgi:hypothetical protein
LLRFIMLYVSLSNGRIGEGYTNGCMSDHRSVLDFKVEAFDF